MAHATSGSVGMLYNVIAKWLQEHKEHLSKSEFGQVATQVREMCGQENLFRSKRAAIDYGTSYPDPQCRIGEKIRIRVAGGTFNGTEQDGPYQYWNPGNGRTAILVGTQQCTGYFVCKVKDSAAVSKDSKAA